MLLTLSGLPGSGTSTLARALAAHLRLAHLDGGQVFRAMAAEQGLGLAELGARAELDPAIDLELDARLARRGAEGDVVLESRLAGWIATHEDLPAVKVWVACDPEERARRVAAREGTDRARARVENDAREASEAERYRSYYGIEIAEMSLYDLVLDSTATPVGALTDKVVEAAERSRSGPSSG